MKRMPLFALLFISIYLCSPSSSSYAAEKSATPKAEPTVIEDETAPKESMSVDEQLDAIDNGPALPAPQANQNHKNIPVSPAPALATPSQENKKGSVGFLEPIDSKHSWYRGSGEWIASRTIRDNLMGDEPLSKIITNGKRYDVSIGKRIPLLSFDEESLTRAWSIGFDGGMLATLFRNSNPSNNVAFSSENFDGFFGVYIARALDDTIFMWRMGHISSHLVDNNPRVLQSIPYSRFWNELIVSQTLSSIKNESLWDIHVQGSVGLNFKSDPAKDNPRVLLGLDLGYALFGTDSLALISGIDARHPGVMHQKNNYGAFVGLGRLRRPETTHRPWRIGAARYWGSDYRNQYYNRTDRYTCAEVQLEF